MGGKTVAQKILDLDLALKWMNYDNRILHKTVDISDDRLGVGIQECACRILSGDVMLFGLLASWELSC